MKALPVWSFCGDADRDADRPQHAHHDRALKREGAQTRLTEYRGVGHNSWDRAYNDPELIDWMLAPAQTMIRLQPQACGERDASLMNDQPIMNPPRPRPRRRYCGLCALAVLTAILAPWVPGECVAQVPKPAATTPVEETRASDVHDAAGPVRGRRDRSARKELRDFESKTGVATMISTVETLGDRSDRG